MNLRRYRSLSTTPWLSMAIWNQCADENLDIADFSGMDCHIGIDQYSKKTACFSVTFKRRIHWQEHYYGFTYTHEGDGITPQNIEQHIRDIASKHNVIRIAYDPYQGLADSLISDNFWMVRFKMNAAGFSGPMLEWEELIKSGHYHHSGCSVMAEMVHNVAIKKNLDGHIMPIRHFQEHGIDGAVAQVMSLGMWLANKEPDIEQKQGRNQRRVARQKAIFNHFP